MASSTSATCPACSTRWTSRPGKAAWTFKTGTEIKSSPVVVGDKVLIGSYDSHLYALGAKDGKLAWKVQTEGYVHATPAVVDGIAYIAGCDEILRGIRITDGNEVFKMPSGAYTGASPAVVDGRAYYGTYENEVLAVDLKTQEDRVELQAPGAELPVLLVAGRAWRPRDRRRPRQDGARPRSQDRQGALDVHDPRARRLVAGRCRRARATSDRTTASSTCSTSRRARPCSSSRPAVRSRPPRPSPTADS